MVMVKRVDYHLRLEKAEKIALVIIAFAVGISIASVNINWICSKFGITLIPKQFQEIYDAVTAGADIASVFATIVGITLPAWVVAAAAALSLYSA